MPVTSTTRRKLGASLLSVAAVAVGIVGFADAQDEPPKTIDRDAAKVAAVDADIKQAYAVFRRAPVSSDGQRGATAAVFGTNAELARYARNTASGAPVYVVPGDGVVCVQGAEVGGSCAPTATAASVPAASVGICGAGIPTGKIIVSALVPDAIGKVTVRAKNGAEVSSSTVGNVLVAYFDRAQAGDLPGALEWQDAKGAAQSQPLDVPDSAAKTVCETSLR